MRLERNLDGFAIDASLLGEMLEVPPSCVQILMRRREITSVCERGEGEHEGQHRLTFFYKGRRARLIVDETGEVIRRSIIDVGDRSLPSAMREAAGG